MSSTVADLVKAGQPVVVLRTFSKIHGMAGLRFGYGIARPDIAATLAAARMSTANIFAVRAARASLGDSAFRADCRRRILASRTRITSELTRLKLRYAEPQGNFVFFDTGMPLARFTTLMREREVLVGRRFPPFENWCRITIGTEPEVRTFLQALRTVSCPPDARATLHTACNRLMQVSAASALCSSSTSSARTATPAAASRRPVSGYAALTSVVPPRVRVLAP